MLELEAELGSHCLPCPRRTGEFGRVVGACAWQRPGRSPPVPSSSERLDFPPLRRRAHAGDGGPVPPGQATRLDVFRAPLVIELQTRLALAPDDLLEALDRWGARALSCRRTPLGRTARRSKRSSAATRGRGRRRCGRRCSSARPRGSGRTSIALRALLDRDGPGARAEDAVRQALVETLLEGSREELVAVLDEALLGLRPRPQVSSSSRVTGRGMTLPDQGGAHAPSPLPTWSSAWCSAPSPIFQWSWITLTDRPGGVAALLLVYRRECAGTSAQESA